MMVLTLHGLLLQKTCHLGNFAGGAESFSPFMLDIYLMTSPRYFLLSYLISWLIVEVLWCSTHSVLDIRFIFQVQWYEAWPLLWFCFFRKETLLHMIYLSSPWEEPYDGLASCTGRGSSYRYPRCFEGCSIHTNRVQSYTMYSSSPPDCLTSSCSLVFQTIESNDILSVASCCGNPVKAGDPAVWVTHAVVVALPFD